MAGWGATGVIGAGLAVLTGRRIGRWTLAIVCFVVGFAFTALQDVGDWVTYSDHSLGQLGCLRRQGGRVRLHPRRRVPACSRSRSGRR